MSCSFPLFPLPFQDHKKCVTLLTTVVLWTKVGYVLVRSVQGSTKWHWSILCFSLPCPSALIPEPCLQLWLRAQCLSPPAAVGWGCPWIRISSSLMCIHAGCLRSPSKLGYRKLSPANLASWFQRARELCFLCLTHTALWVLSRRRFGPE